MKNARWGAGHRGRVVRVKGLEPLRLAARDPKSRLATNYNTPAVEDCKDNNYGSIWESFRPRK